MKDIRQFINEGQHLINHDGIKVTAGDVLTWLTKTGALKHDSNWSAEEFAQAAQDAAEDAGISIEDAEYVYDYAYEICDKFGC
jgi:hypothetical protein